MGNAQVRTICSPVDVVTVVLAGGRIEEYKRPVLAGDIMLLHPRHHVVRPDFFRVSAVIVLRPEEVLLPGHKFFLVPFHTVYKKLQQRVELLTNTRATESAAAAAAAETSRLIQMDLDINSNGNFRHRPISVGCSPQAAPSIAKSGPISSDEKSSLLTSSENLSPPLLPKCGPLLSKPPAAGAPAAAGRAPAPKNGKSSPTSPLQHRRSPIHRTMVSRNASRITVQSQIRRTAADSDQPLSLKTPPRQPSVDVVDRQVTQQRRSITLRSHLGKPCWAEFKEPLLSANFTECQPLETTDYQSGNDDDLYSDENDDDNESMLLDSPSAAAITKQTAAWLDNNILLDSPKMTKETATSWLDLCFPEYESFEPSPMHAKSSREETFFKESSMTATLTDRDDKIFEAMDYTYYTPKGSPLLLMAPASDADSQIDALIKEFLDAREDFGANRRTKKDSVGKPPRPGLIPRPTSLEWNHQKITIKIARRSPAIQSPAMTSPAATSPANGCNGSEIALPGENRLIIQAPSISKPLISHETQCALDDTAKQLQLQLQEEENQRPSWLRELEMVQTPAGKKEFVVKGVKPVSGGKQLLQQVKEYSSKTTGTEPKRQQKKKKTTPEQQPGCLALVLGKAAPENNPSVAKLLNNRPPKPPRTACPSALHPDDPNPRALAKVDPNIMSPLIKVDKNSLTLGKHESVPRKPKTCRRSKLVSSLCFLNAESLQSPLCAAAISAAGTQQQKRRLKLRDHLKISDHALDREIVSSTEFSSNDRRHKLSGNGGEFTSRKETVTIRITQPVRTKSWGPPPPISISDRLASIEENFLQVQPIMFRPRKIRNRRRIHTMHNWKPKLSPLVEFSPEFHSFTSSLSV